MVSEIMILRRWEISNEMRYIFIVLSIFCCNATTWGQAQVFTYTERDTKVEGKHYRFPEFKKGIITRTNGEPVVTQLNYNLATEEIVVDLGHSKTPYQINDKVISIVIDNVTFVHDQGIVYEEIYTDTVSLLVHRFQKLSRLGQNTGLGRSGSVNSKELPPSNEQLYELAIPGTFEATDINTYFVRKDGKFIAVSKLKDLINIFPAMRDDLKDFSKKERIKFQREDHLIKLLRFCNQKIR